MGMEGGVTKTMRYNEREGIVFSKIEEMGMANYMIGQDRFMLWQK